MNSEENNECDSNRFGERVEEAVCPNCGHGNVSYSGYYYTCENCLYKSDNATEWFPQRSKEAEGKLKLFGKRLSFPYWKVILLIFILLALFVYGSYSNFLPSTLSNTIASSLLVIVTASYVLMTWELVKTTKNARKQEVLPSLKIELQPVSLSSYGVKIVNAGNGPAQDVDLKLTLIAQNKSAKELSHSVNNIDAGDFIGFHSPFQGVTLNESTHKNYNKLVLNGKCNDVFGDTHKVGDEYDLELLKNRDESAFFETRKERYLKDIADELKDISGNI